MDPTEKSPPQPSLFGIKEADFLAWRHHPVTKVFVSYLTDYRAALQRDHIDRWEGGRLDPDTESEAKGRCNTLQELATLQFGAMLQFYGDIEEGKKDEENAN